MPEESIWRLYHLGGEKEDDRSRDGWTVSNEARLLSEHQKMKLILSKIDLELRLALALVGHRTTTSPRYAACPDSRYLERLKTPSSLRNQ